MPFLKPFKPSATALKESKTLKNGERHAVFKIAQGFYRGAWRNNNKNGLGSFFSNKSKYEGGWKTDRRHGYGIFSRKREDGSYDLWYEGSWKNGKPHGIGARYFTDGSIYQGGFINGRRQGSGRIWYADGSFYDGQWFQDKRHGNGLFVYPNGNRYEGRWERGMKNGEGVYHHFCTGQDQIGIWSDDICVSSRMVDSPYRSAAVLPTPYPIPPLAAIQENHSARSGWND